MIQFAILVLAAGFLAWSWYQGWKLRKFYNSPEEDE